MSCSKPLPPFTYDLLCFLNREQLERFAIVCSSVKNLIERYFNSKPCRVFYRLEIRGGSFALADKGIQWHPKRDDYSVQQFLSGQKCSSDESKNHRDDFEYYTFAEMLPYLGSSIRIQSTFICVAGDFTYNPEHIAELESLAYLWRDGDINILNANGGQFRVGAEDFLPILNSPTILQCQVLTMFNAHFAFKDYKILYAVKVIDLLYQLNKEDDPNYWQQFLEQPGVKPIVGLHDLCRENIVNLLDRLSKDFSSAILPNAFKIVFADIEVQLTEFRETNNTSGEILELKKGFPVDYQVLFLYSYDYYTLERTKI